MPPPRRQTPCRGPCCRPKDRYSTSHAALLRFAIIAALPLPNQQKTPGPIFGSAPALRRLAPRCSPSSLFASARLTHVPREEHISTNAGRPRESVVNEKVTSRYRRRPP